LELNLRIKPRERLKRDKSGKLIEWTEARGIAIRHIQLENSHRQAPMARPTDHRGGPEFRHAVAMDLQNDRPNMGVGGMTPTQKLNAAG
jgi:hypothetical protein